MAIVFQNKMSTSHFPTKQAVPWGLLMSFADTNAESLCKGWIRRAEINVFGEKAACSSVKAMHRERLEEGNVLKPENVTVPQEICRFLKGRRSVCSVAWPPRTRECFSLSDISSLPSPDSVIGLLLTCFTPWRRLQSCWILTSSSCSKMTLQSVKVPLVSDSSVSVEGISGSEMRPSLFGGFGHCRCLGAWSALIFLLPIGSSLVRSFVLDLMLP